MVEIVKLLRGVELRALDALRVLQGMALEVFVLGRVHIANETTPFILEVGPVALRWVVGLLLFDLSLLGFDLHVHKLLDQDLLVGVSFLGDALHYLLFVDFKLLDGKFLGGVHLDVVKIILTLYFTNRRRTTEPLLFRLVCLLLGLLLT